jgi:hypothetical protein
MTKKIKESHKNETFSICSLFEGREEVKRVAQPSGKQTRAKQSKAKEHQHVGLKIFVSSFIGTSLLILPSHHLDEVTFGNKSAGSIPDETFYSRKVKSFIGGKATGLDQKNVVLLETGPTRVVQQAKGEQE